MGVLNVTPDSFSDGGCFADAPSAIAHGLALHAAGADYVDVGGESTRPGADRVDAVEECRRGLPGGRGLPRAGAPGSGAPTPPRGGRAAPPARGGVGHD